MSVLGIETFRRYVEGFENDYMLIGGSACDLLLADIGFGSASNLSSRQKCG